MAKTTTQRQQDYRKSRPIAGENGERRINTWVSTATALSLERLSRRYGVTMRQFLEDLVKEANDQVVATLELDTAEWAEYFQHPALRSNKTSSPSG